MDLSRVPAELRAEPRWVCWRAQARDGRTTKLPVNPSTGRMASSTDATTWSDFDTAIAAVGRWHASGVGFVFAPDRAFTGLDLDHVISGGALADAYRWVVSEAHTYCEVSPSGDGLHLIFRGSKPEGATRCRRGCVEMYDHDRFFTVTGDVFEGHGRLGSNPSVVERAYRTWIDPSLGAGMRQAEIPGGGGAAGDAGAPDDAELVRRMRASRNGAAIGALLDGDLSAYGGDHSAADMALCSSLAFWCAGDADRMDRIFRASGLMRDKWDSRRGGSTYGAQTIARALEGCTEFYEPRRRRSAGHAGTADAGGKPPRSRRAHDTNNCSIARTSPREKDPAASPSPDADAEPAFDPDRAPSVEGWQVDSRGRLWVVGRDGELRYTVTSTAPWIACDLVDVDTRDVRALVRVRVPGGVRERAVGRDVLLNQSKVIGVLAPLGANVSSSNCKEVIRYLTDCEKRFGWMRPRLESVTHLGWADGPLGAFMPYDAGGTDGGDADGPEGGGGGATLVRFDPSPDEAVKARPFLEPAGTLDGWVAGVAPARERSQAFRCVLAASFASPLVSVVGVQTFIVYLWGRSRSGKTPTLKAAGSVWGDPTEGADSYFRTFADTPKSIVRAAALLHDVPVIVDELQSKGAPGGQGAKRQVVEDLLYSLSLGHERGALNSDRSMMRAGSWRCLTIATGEIPIVGGSTQQGAANRTLELNAEPFSDVREAQAMHHLVAAQHGTAGRTFVRSLRRNAAGWYTDEYARIRDAVGGMAAGHPQADNVALLALADALASFYVFGVPDWDECVRQALEMARWALANSTGAEAGDTDLKAIQFVAEWLTRNVLHFEDSAEMDRLERWGEISRRPGEAGFTWCVFSSVLDRALESENYDRQKTLRRMDDEGLLVTGSGRRFTMQRRFRGGTRRYCVCIDNARLEELLDRVAGRATGDALASSAGDPR
jgi:hypothetical protein